MAKVLVTGFGGFLGSEICRQLLKRGHQVTGIARGDYPEMRSAGVSAMQGDLAERNTAIASVQNVDAVIHTAAKAGVWGKPEIYETANYTTTANLLSAAQDSSVQAFVNCSSPSVTFDGRDQNNVDETTPYPTTWMCHYPRTKALAEKLVIDANSRQLRTCSLRPHLIWGKGDPHLFPRLIERAKSGRLKCIGDGRNLIDTVHVELAAAAHVNAVDKLLSSETSPCAGKCYFISDGDPIECWQWISEILNAANVPVPNGRISFRAAHAIGAVLEMIYIALGKQSEPPMTRFVASQLGKAHYFDVSASHRDLELEPLKDRAERLKELRPWLLDLASNT